MLRKASLPIALVLTSLCLFCGACDRRENTASTAGPGPATHSASTQTAPSNTVDASGTATPAANQVVANVDAGAGAAAPLTKRGGGKVTVGFSQIGAESAWRTAETKSVDAEGPKRGVDLKVVDAQGKQENQIRTLGTFITQRVDAIILAPVVETGWEPVLRQAKRANIPVVLVDRGVKAPEDLYATLIASDFVSEGRRAGDWLATATGGKCAIAELQGTTGAAPANDRAKGFRDSIAQHPGMKILLSQTANFTRGDGKAVMEAFLKSPQGSEIQAVYAHNDDMALGAIQAIEEAGKVPGKDIKVVSIDGGKAALQAVADGKINCSVECSPRLAPQAFDAVSTLLNGGTVPKKQVVKDRLFDATNAKDVLTSGDYWE